MSLGGYIFRGYTCSKPSGISNTDWYLLIHKTRVKAFLEASNAADAGWVIDHTGGQIAFESTNGAIYRLDDLGYNYITTFKIPDEGAYFQILTLCNWTTDTADLANGVVSIVTPIEYSSTSSTTKYFSVIQKTTLFHRIGSTRHDPSLSANKYCMTPIITAGSVFDASTSSGHKSCNADSTTNLFTGYSTCRYGYAIRGKHIISVIQNSNSTLYFSLLSADIYQTRFNNSDTFVGFNAINFANRGSENNTSGETTFNGSNASYYTTQYLKSNSSYKVSQAFIPLRTSNYTQATTVVYPFSSVYVSMTTETQDIQTNGIGSIPIDLMATNTTTGTPFDVGCVVANGNYICVSSTSTTSTYVMTLSFTIKKGWGTSNYIGENIFLGWDPSNPNLSETSSWPIYREPVPYTYTSHNVGNTIYYTITLTGVSGNGTIHAEGYIIESNSSGQAQHREINGNYNYTNGSFDLVGNWPFAVSSGCSLQISFV